jgi:hypothetical protein
MTNKSRLLSGKVLTNSSANVSLSRYQFLDLSSAEPNLGSGNTGDVLSFNSSYPGGRRWIPQGDIAGSIGQSAYVEANTASANTLYLSGVDLAQNTRIGIIEGVDLWQNTEITAASSLAQGAFARANSGARATSSNTAPTGNTVGDLWLSLTDETLYMYSYDGVSNNWVDISGPILRSSNIVVQYTITSNVS